MGQVAVVAGAELGLAIALGQARRHDDDARSEAVVADAGRAQAVGGLRRLESPALAVGSAGGHVQNVEAMVGDDAQRAYPGPHQAAQQQQLRLEPALPNERYMVATSAERRRRLRPQAAGELRGL